MGKVYSKGPDRATVGDPEPALKLFRHIFGGERGLLHIFTAIRSSKELTQPSARHFDYPQEARDAVEWAHDRTQEGREAYFCAHLLTRAQRIKGNAAEARAAWFEMDGGELPNGQLRPTAVVESSPGHYQGYYRFTDPVPPETVEDINERLALEIGADPSGYDLTQLLRVPGTVNHKYRERPVVRLLDVQAGREYAPRELEDLLPKLGQHDAPPPEQGDDEPPIMLSPEAAKVYRGEKPKAKPDTGELDRSGTLMKIGRVLFDAGANERVLVDALSERDRALGYEKYSGNRDGGRREYERIYEKLKAAGRNERASFTVKRGEGRVAEAPSPNGTGQPPPTAVGGPKLNLTDLGNAQRFVRDHGPNIRYCYPWGKWLVWDDKRWRVDDSGEVERLMKASVRAIYAEAAAEEDDERRKNLTNHARRSESKARITDALYLARSEPGVAVPPDDLDADPWLFNTASGTIDLHSGEVRVHRREDLITKLAPHEYDPDAEAPRFARFIKEVFEGDEGLITFVQRFAGYCLTGSTEERALAILHGTGKNGKTTLVELLRDVLGDYAKNTDIETVLRKRHAGISNDVAALKGARFVSSAEVEKGRALAESKVKNLTGSDTVTARFLFAEPFDFQPEFKLWLSTNNKPVIYGTDDAIWDRIRLIPFTQRFTGDRADRALPRKLREELPGVLAWMVRGCVEWQRHGLGESEKVDAATQGYRAEMDVLAGFIEERCVVKPDVWCKFSDLYTAYTEWCAESNEHADSSRRFADSLTERGFAKDTGAKNVKIRRGIALRHDGDGDGARVTEPPPDEGHDKHTIPDKAPEAENIGNPVTDPEDFGNPQNTCKTAGYEEGVTEGYRDSASLGDFPSTREGFGKSVTVGNFGNFGNPVGNSEGWFAADEKPAPGTPRDLLADPPEWLAKQLRNLLANPDTLLGPTAAAISAVVYGSSNREDEVVPILVAYLGESEDL